MMHICVIAGEPSGDYLGGQLIKSLRAMKPEAHITGVGGEHMAAAGLSSLFPYQDLAVMGIAEVLPKLPILLNRIQRAADHIIQTKPDVVVTIDSPDFCFRVIRAVKKRGGAKLPKFIHYVAPTVWAWREGRAEKIANLVDGLICLFDFEPPYFERHGLRTIAIGHPMVEGRAMAGNAMRYREEEAMPQNAKTLGILFGSRRGEIKNTGPILRDAAYQLAVKMGGDVHIIVPTLPHIKESVYALMSACPNPVHMTTKMDEKYDAFKAMDIAIAVSGTVGLELAAMQVPHVIAYKTNPITAAIVRRMIKVKYAHLANIMADRAIVPEYIQDHCIAGDIAEGAYGIWQNPRIQKHDLANIAQRLGYGQTKTPSDKAAGFVLSL